MRSYAAASSPQVLAYLLSCQLSAATKPQCDTSPAPLSSSQTSRVEMLPLVRMKPVRFACLSPQPEILLSEPRLSRTSSKAMPASLSPAVRPGWPYSLNAQTYAARTHTLSKAQGLPRSSPTSRTSNAICRSPQSQVMACSSSNVMIPCHRPESVLLSRARPWMAS